MLFDLWEFQGRSMILLDIKTGAVKSFEVSMKSDCPVIVHLTLPTQLKTKRLITDDPVAT